MAIMFSIPVPGWHWPAMRMHNLVILGSLPPVVRERYGLRWTRAQEAAFRGGSRKAEMNLGWVALRRGEPERALAQFDRHPEDPEALRGAARALVALGRQKEALEKYERAVALAPENAALRYELDREYDRAGKK